MIAVFMGLVFISSLPSCLILGEVNVVESNSIDVNIQFISSGPMIGHVSMRSANIWVQMNEEAPIALKYWSSDNNNASSALFSVVILTSKSDAYTAIFKLSDLDPGTEYRAVVVSNGRVLSDEISINTQVLWDYRIDPPEFKVLAGSCAFINDSIYDRPGKPYGGEYNIFEVMASEEADMMLWLGDNVYLREVDFQSYSGYLYRYTHTRGIPEMQDLLSSCPNYAIWDDHDFGPNDADRSWIHGDWAKDAFQTFWANPSYGAPSGSDNVGTAFRFNDVEFFLLDNRTDRVHHYNRTQDLQVLGEGQIDWLIAALNKSRAPFKIVAIGGQFLSDNAKHENMARYPERQTIIDRIEEERIHGVVFLSGDRHCTELSRLELDKGVVIHDLTTSPLTSSSYDNSDEENTLRVEGTVVAERNYAELNFSGPRKDRVMVIVIKNAVGEEVWSKELKAKDL
jgi:alkaline phosphatase D